MKRISNIRGSATALYLCALLLLSSLLIISVDFAGAWFLRNSFVNDLAAMKVALESPHNSLLIKNADYGQPQIVDTVVADLRKRGFEGEIRVWCLEEDLQGQDDKRILSWCVQISDDYHPALFSKFGDSAIVVGADIYGSFMAFSHKNTYTPTAPNSASGIYRIAKNSTFAKFTHIKSENSNEYPPTLLQSYKDAKEIFLTKEE